MYIYSLSNSKKGTLSSRIYLTVEITNQGLVQIFALIRDYPEEVHESDSDDEKPQEEILIDVDPDLIPMTLSYDTIVACHFKPLYREKGTETLKVALELHYLYDETEDEAHMMYIDIKKFAEEIRRDVAEEERMTLTCSATSIRSHIITIEDNNPATADDYLIQFLLAEVNSEEAREARNYYNESFFKKAFEEYQTLLQEGRELMKRKKEQAIHFANYVSNWPYYKYNQSTNTKTGIRKYKSIRNGDLQTVLDNKIMNKQLQAAVNRRHLAQDKSKDELFPCGTICN